MNAMPYKKEFIQAYRTAVEFCSGLDDDEEGAQWSPELEGKIQTDASLFFDSHQEDIIIAVATTAIKYSVTQAAYDLWFTRNGTGVGYWEKDGDCFQRLDKAAQSLGRCELYIGDDGLVYKS